MKICISGLGSSGKTSMGKLLSRQLDIEHLGATYKSEVKNDRELISMLKRHIAKKDVPYAREFDKRLAEASKGKNCVITTWLGPWTIKDATVRVWLNASQVERARRRARINRKGYNDSLGIIKEYDRVAPLYFKKVCGVDINDRKIFDMELNTERLSEKECAELIALLALSRENVAFR